MKSYLTVSFTLLLLFSFILPAFAMLPNKLSQSEFGNLANQIKRLEEDLKNPKKRKDANTDSGKKKMEKRKKTLEKKLKELKAGYEKQIAAREKQIQNENASLKAKIKRGGRNKVAWERSLANNEEDLLRLKAFRYMVDYEQGMDFSKLEASKNAPPAPPAKKK